MPPPNLVGALGSHKVQDLLASTIQPVLVMGGHLGSPLRRGVWDGLDPTTYGKDWFDRSTSALAAFTDADEVAYWRRCNISRFVVPWNNAYITGLHETIMIVNAIQQFVVPIKSIPAQGSSVWTSIVASVGMFNLLLYASMFTVSSDASHFDQRPVPNHERFGTVFLYSLESTMFHEFLWPLAAVDLISPPKCVLA
ncbi:hypothetical protein DYB37_001746 [Aphanomyces astaci]|uniref:Uncharacterized protein n=1 Tax=Aphanomyces astaci TaxID=112090 RepID=A0A418FEM2_APHAT|nr:hypothetical protein DYB35_003960 [Aphanomyces astaci]RHZ28027.1 hypothetical protein DYB37_001746 [Aphanomyces astaci]